MFSQKYGYRNLNKETETITPALRNRIWNYFYQNDIQKTTGKRMMDSLKLDMTFEKKVADKMGFNVGQLFLLREMEKYITETCEWYRVYDFVEAYLSCVNKNLDVKIDELNKILEEENSKYRIVNGEVSPLNNKLEITEIESAINQPYESVRKHFSKALDLFSNRSKPDYENSIKESISAVEAMCCIITGQNKATLGDAIDKLSEKGVHIHGAMKSAFSALYGYTSDESGIRHGSIDFINAPAEDAKFMLVSCSAFVNYLIEKWSKVNKK